MAVTTRGRRNIDFEEAHTDKNLGPGTYNPRDLAQWKVKHGRAPFGSTTERALHESKDLNTPGPGTYKEGLEVGGVGQSIPTGGGSRVRASSTFASRTMRMANDTELPKKAMLPGPGSYDTNTKWIKKSMAVAASPKDASKAINWVKVSTAPSIPAPNQSYGYEEGPKGELIQQKPPNVGFSGKNTYETAGPGYYDPKADLTKSSATRAPAWGRPSKSGREGVQVSKELQSRPGPGSYEPPKSTLGVPKPADMQGDDQIKPSPVFMSATRRDRMTFAAASDTPGPGSYNPPSQFKSAAEVSASAPDQMQAFGSTSRKQFHTPQEQHPVTVRNPTVPGPGTYDEAVLVGFERKAKEKDQVGGVTKPNVHGAFSSTVHRFHEAKTTSKQTPGPGYYGAEKGMSANIGKKTVGRYGIFGSTSQRFPAPPKSTQPTGDTGIGPGSYDPKSDASPAETRRKDVRNATFSSRTARKAIPSDAPLDVPPVGSYSANQSNDWLRKSNNVRKNCGMSQAPRFNIIENKKNNTPGPGHYTTTGSGGTVVLHGELKAPTYTGLDRQGKNKPHGSQAPRFKIDVEKDRVPGPGAYNLEGSMVKRTFNITIGDSWA
eukprot:TRINITY_DN60861_c0_g3_i1.p1 TRINITY_DN60861_c0_g3~~TRINITY_DN60861_c0_g3_i1.p1  ORF type:complete len:603 (-),score=57.70 TRINITY_DN60861_c0_g3_i1:131-1939(-)